MKENQKFEAVPPEPQVEPQKVVGQSSEAPSGRFKDLTVEGSLTVKSPDGKGSIVMMASNNTTGLWVQNGQQNQNIGIYAQSNGQLAICVYGPKDRFPRFAIGVYGDSPADLQIAPPGQGFPEVGSKIKFISLDRLAKLVEEHGVDAGTQPSPSPTPTPSSPPAPPVQPE